jgi:hypothetical protein
LLAVLVFCLGAAACRSEPALTAASGDQSVFAEAYPARLSELRSAFAEQEKRARSNLAALRAPPAGLRDNERALAKGLFERADRSGRSGYYADEAVRQEELDQLFEEGRAGLRRRRGRLRLLHGEAEEVRRSGLQRGAGDRAGQRGRVRRRFARSTGSKSSASTRTARPRTTSTRTRPS